jgi:hypothetical protein
MEAFRIQLCLTAISSFERPTPKRLRTSPLVYATTSSSQISGLHEIQTLERSMTCELVQISGHLFRR